jgi:predicted cupin superfamily sugar epimerase
MLIDFPSDPKSIIDAFGMVPHPEGGWYTETFRALATPSTRSAVSAIYFLLQADERSHWHTVDACEIWLWHAGSPLKLHLSHDSKTVETTLLGIQLAQSQRPQAVVPAGVWQAAESTGAWSLVSCIVAPAFDFAGFQMAPRGWAPATNPGEQNTIRELSPE